MGLSPHDTLPETVRNDICRAFQDAVVDVLVAKSQRALLQTGFRTLVVAGGVGANWKLREILSHLQVQAAPKSPRENVKTHFPPLPLCTDNGAMMAFAGAMRLQHGVQVAEPSGQFDVKPRWSLREIVRDGVQAA